MKKKIISFFFLFLCLIMLTGCPWETSFSEEDNVQAETVFILNYRNTYTLAEAVCPKDQQDAMPLVVIAHGFTGSIDSGGAKELTRRLAEAGIASVRLDFNAYLSPSEKGERAQEYTLQTMEDDMVTAIHFMTGNYNIDTRRIGLYGRSMGGRTAMMMANENYGGFDYQAMALVAPAGNQNAMIYFMGGAEAWEEMKAEAAEKGWVTYKDLRLRPQWFSQFESYDPCAHGSQFGHKPVLVICNTLDYVVTDETSRECASAYENSRIIQVTTQDYHGYEMSYENSSLKDQLMDAIVEHFKENL